MLNNKKIVFTTGGTGGHINPALAVAGEIRRKYPKAEILFIGTSDRLETKLVPDAGFELRTIEMSGFQRKPSIQNLKKNLVTVKRLMTVTGKVRKIFASFNPDIVIGFGGYVSGPVVRTAAKMGIPTVIHEQNAFPGVTTKMLAPNADAVMLAMKEAKKYLKIKKEPIITGNPVRSELLKITRESARKALGLDNRPLLLSFGGSLGARPINEAVAQLVRHYNGSEFNHIHATGKFGFNAFNESLSDISISDNVDIREYISDMDVCMAAADLVICRAGAITLSELQACKKPSVLIPSPYVAENHQFHNAMTLKNVGAAEIIEEKNLSGETLIETVKSLTADEATLGSMGENAKKSAIINANERIYDVITELLKK